MGHDPFIPLAVAASVTERVELGTAIAVAFRPHADGVGHDRERPATGVDRSIRGEWVAMGELITDEMLDTFAVVAEPEPIAAGITARWGSVIDRISFDAPYRSDPEIRR